MTLAHELELILEMLDPFDAAHKIKTPRFDRKSSIEVDFDTGYARNLEEFRIDVSGGDLIPHFVKLAGQRVPIGSLGDGIWRLLGIALALVRARGGVLLVDEIDTGLHYSVLESMWRLVNETARRLDVQVFATTHSRDCYESLAAIAQPTGRDVTIQRIERGKPLAVAFSEAEILEAARRGIEVR